ncbi:MAG TPA: hypothetical protein VG367_17795 [Mucilaginibacter sp.]|jgi:hypothetical protein|nr:hypothetical protein [Mucilaginibacter sp.]
MKSGAFEKFLVLYIPWLLSLIFKADPVVSYFIAWLGSFFIFYVTLTGKIKPLPKDRPIAEQIMRPIFLVQIIFAGYMACTSIFFFFDIMGYQDFHKTSLYYLVDQDQLELTAQCQRYYCLAHAAFVTGILSFMNYPVKSKYKIEDEKVADLLYKMAIVTLPASMLFLKIPGLSQFANQFNSLSFIACTLALAFAIPLHKVWNTLVCFGLYSFNVYQALTSGFKEPIILSILVLGIFLYPTYKKLVFITFAPLLLALFVVLPSYNQAYRQSAWADEESADEASQQALDAALKNTDDTAQKETNWIFLSYRLSEIEMFTKFLKSTPDKVDFYNFQLLEQSAIVVIPRILWPSKPITEELVMQRVYDAGVVNANSNVSAKPAFVVDAYLSYGGIGIFIAMLIYGSVAQLISIKAEKLFGGYVLGTALIFSGLFQIMWRGLSFEFLINTVFWSYVSMLIIHRIMVGQHILTEA